MAFRRITARSVWLVPLAALAFTACEHNPTAPPDLASISISPTPITLATGATQQYTAVGTDIYGNPIAISPNWSVADGGSIKANIPAVGRGVSTMVSVIAGAGNQRELLLPAVAI